MDAPREPPGHRTTRAWRDLEFRIGLQLLLALAFIPVNLVAALVASAFAHAIVFPVWFGVGYGVLYLAAAIRLRSFRCPACGRFFSFSNAPPTRCRHCGTSRPRRA